MDKNPVFPQFSSVSNDEMENNTNFPALTLSHLCIDVNAINPNTHSVTPPLETPTYSYCRPPTLNLDESSNTATTTTTTNMISHGGRMYQEMNHSNHTNDDAPEDEVGFPSKRKLSPKTQTNKRFANNSHHPPRHQSQLMFTEPSFPLNTANQNLNANFNLGSNFNNELPINTSRASSSSSTFSFEMSSSPSNIISSSSTLQTPQLLLQSSIAPSCLFYQGTISLKLFEIFDHLGEGVAAEVVHVVSRLEKTKTFAMKKFRKQIRNQRQQEKLLKEFQIMNELNHLQCPNIPIFYVAWKETDYLYSIMEYAEYGNVKQLMEYHQQNSFQMTIPFLWHLIHNVCCALQFIHGQGFVHLDIKPANLLIFANAMVKIGDFGLATKAGESSTDDPEGDDRYLPYELLNSYERTFSADIFSLGISLYELAHIILNEGGDPIMQLQQPSHSHGRELLPAVGPFWQNLRSGNFQLPEKIPMELGLLIRGMMNPIPTSRPIASDILTLADVASIEQNKSLYLDAWENVSFNQPRIMNRSASYDPMMNH